VGSGNGCGELQEHPSRLSASAAKPEMRRHTVQSASCESTPAIPRPSKRTTHTSLRAARQKPQGRVPKHRRGRGGEGRGGERVTKKGEGRAEDGEVE